MKLFRPIRFRLALWSALITGLIIVVFATLFISVINSQYLDAIDSEMERFGEELVEELDDGDRFDEDELVDLFDLFDDRKSLHLIAVVSPDGKVVFQSSHWEDYSLELDRDRSSYHRSIIHDDDKWRYSRIKENRWQIFVGNQLDEVDEMMDQILVTFLYLLPVALLLAALGGLVLAHRAMKPVKLITQTANEISAQGLEQRIANEGLVNDELGQLAEVLNSMLARLQSSFEQTSRFSSDASHELSTPLAIMQGELESALQREELSAEDETLLANLLEETQRLKTITRSLLLFSRSDAGTLKLEKESLDLGKLILPLVEDVRSLELAEKLSFEVEVDAGISVKGDKTLLRQAIYNLLTNAVHYNLPNGVVKISLGQTAGRVSCTISNSGPGISQRNVAYIFDRFFREDSSRTRKQDGFGLGLPLAREIVRAHGGDVRLLKSDTETTTFELTLSSIS